MKKISKEMKDWFGKGEYDIDLMILLGVLKEKTILQICEQDPKSPWYKEKLTWPRP